jgi:DNA-binding IscR family transcriptional regulator
MRSLWRLRESSCASTLHVSTRQLGGTALVGATVPLYETVRGRNGGIRLMREPPHINIGQVVRDTENQLGVIGCLERRGYCPIERACVLRSALQDATQAFLAVLDSYTLADLIKPQRTLSSLLFDHRVSLH